MNEKLNLLLTQLSSVIFGKERECRLTVCALLAGGDLLVEDVPGVGKTTLALALAQSLDLSFGRIQFTPDTLPGDVTGYSTIDLRTGALQYHEGPVMHNIVLADEINRTSPKTQASLLEVMAERQVTAEGKTYPLPRPFMVIATENPIEFAGTYHLPEAQLDRFLMRISMGYPAEADELNMLRARLASTEQIALKPVLTGPELLALLAVIGAAVLIGFRGGMASYLLFWTTLLPPLSALIWQVTAGRRFQAVMRADAPSALRGERLGCSLVLVNNSPLPIPSVSVRIGGERLSFEESDRMRLSLAPGEMRELRFKPLCLHCGKTEFGAAELRLRDPFALSERRLSSLTTLRVKPRLLRLPRLLISQPEELEQRTGARTYLGERTPNGELRAYLPGDDVRRVNWKVSALQGRPMIRDTEPQSRDELVLLPDLRDALPAGEAAYLAEDSIREGSLAQAVADLSGEVRDLPDGGILFEDELPVLVCEDLQRVEIMDLYG